MSTRTWSGRRVRVLVDATLATKGRVCHLCQLEGADSADHDPPRSELLAAGVLNPDTLEYLFPSHRYPCNVGRGARPITPELRAEMRTKRLAAEGRAESAAPLSPRFASRRPFFPTDAPPGSPRPSVSPRDLSEKRE